MNPAILPILAFISCTFAVVGLASLVSDMLKRGRARVDARLKEEFRAQLREKVQQSPLFRNLKVLAAQPNLERHGLRGWLETLIEQSGLDVEAGRIMATAGTTAAAAALLAAALGVHPLIAVACAPVGFAVPLACLIVARQKRIDRLCSQLPEAFELMSRAVRAGQTMASAFQAVADQMPPPISEEFALCYEKQSLGLPYDVALRELGRRTGVMELQMFVVALLVQRQSGGSPVEMLQTLSSVIRKRIKLSGKVKSLTAEGRMQALVLLLLPPAAMAAMMTLNREYVEKLLDRTWLLGAITASEIVGALWIRRIVRIRY